MPKRFSTLQIKRGDRILYTPRPLPHTDEFPVIKRGVKKPHYFGRRGRNARLACYDKFVGANHPHRLRRA